MPRLFKGQLVDGVEVVDVVGGEWERAFLAAALEVQLFQ